MLACLELSPAVGELIVADALCKAVASAALYAHVCDNALGLCAVLYEIALNAALQHHLYDEYDTQESRNSSTGKHKYACQLIGLSVDLEGIALVYVALIVLTHECGLSADTVGDTGVDSLALGVYVVNIDLAGVADSYIVRNNAVRKHSTLWDSHGIERHEYKCSGYHQDKYESDEYGTCQ